MGRHKAGLPFGDSNLLWHRLSTLQAAGFEAAIAGLPAGMPVPAKVSSVADRFAGAGPLAGMEAALRSLADEDTQLVLFAPVDLPLLPPEFFHALWSRAGQTDAWATVPFALGRPQPLCAVYSSALAAGIGRALADCNRKVMQVIQSVAPGSRLDTFPVEALAPLQGWGETHRWFTNLNTPADWTAFTAGKSIDHCRPVARIYQGDLPFRHD